MNLFIPSIVWDSKTTGSCNVRSFATSEVLFFYREYFRSFTRCGAFAGYRKSAVVHVGVEYARHSFDVKAARESLTPSPSHPVVSSALIFYCASFDFTPRVSAYGDRTFWAFCLQLTASIHPCPPCKLRKVLCARRMILYKSRRLPSDRIWAFTYEIENEKKISGRRI